MNQVEFRIKDRDSYSVTFRCEIVGRIKHHKDGTYHVSDVRQATTDKIYGTRDEAFFHFVSFNWKSVLGRSSLATIDNRVIRRNKYSTQRWAVN